MSKHTPGPWKWDGPVWDYDHEDEAPWLVDNKGVPILKGSIWCSSEHAARLIAQAPRLLEALKGLDEAYCRALMPLTKQERHEDRLRLIEARAAIAAATEGDGHE